MFTKNNLSLGRDYKESNPLNCFWEQLFWASHGWSSLRPGRAGVDTKQFRKLMVERQSVPVMALLPGDAEFGARNIWAWEEGGTPEGERCRRVEQRFMDAGDFLLDWLVCVFTATKSGDRENSGYEHSELVPAQAGSCCVTATLPNPCTELLWIHRAPGTELGSPLTRGDTGEAFQFPSTPLTAT